MSSNVGFDLLSGIILIPLYFGWLYFPYRYFVDGDLSGRFWSLSKIAAIATLFSIYWISLTSDWDSLPSYWLTRGSYAYLASKMWSIYGLSLWAVAIILYPRIVRDLLAKPSGLQPFPHEMYALFGWIFLGYSYIALSSRAN